MKISDNAKNIAVLFIVFAVIVLAYITFFPQSQPATIERGEEVDRETFLSLLSNADKIYIVMDIRGATNGSVSTNIMQCGIDFSSSRPLAVKNVTYISMNESHCFVGELGESAKVETTTPADCMAIVKDGISLYVEEGFETRYYSKAAVIGVNEYYEVGTCSITAR